MWPPPSTRTSAPPPVAEMVKNFNRVFFEGVAGALNERGGASHVEYGRPERAPLLVLAGEIDHVVPPAIAKAIAHWRISVAHPRTRLVDGS